jgi:hypothetical protein
MSVSDDDLRAIWQQGATDVSFDRSGCLTDVEWASLLSKEADDQERARAAEHIGACATCADEYRLLLPLQSWTAEVEEALSPADAVHRARTSDWRGWFALPRRAFALAAAALLLITQGVPVYLLVKSRQQNSQLEAQLAQDKTALSSTQTSLATLQKQLQRRPPMQTAEQLTTQQPRVSQLSTPQLDIPIIDLDPRDTNSVRGSTRPQIVTIDAQTSLVTLILNFSPLASRSTLEVEVTDQSGSARWVGRTARDRSAASLTLALPTHDYAAGRYDIRVFDVTRGRTLLATYPVIIRASPAKDR